MTTQLTFYVDGPNHELPDDPVPVSGYSNRVEFIPPDTEHDGARKYTIGLPSVVTELQVIFREGVEGGRTRVVQVDSPYIMLQHVEAVALVDECVHCFEEIVLLNTDNINAIVYGFREFLLRAEEYNAAREGWAYVEMAPEFSYITASPTEVLHANCGTFCVECGEVIDNSEDTINGLCDSCAPTCRECDEPSNDRYEEFGGYCEDCWREQRAEVQANRERMHSLIHNYTYKPEPNFLGDGKLFFGLELEMKGDAYEIAGRVHALDEDERVFYCKSDASVAGTEIVTHPMSPDWIRGDPSITNLMATLNERESTAVVTRGDQDTGVHIHVSRSGFNSPYHMWKFGFFQYANSLYVQWLAGRAAVRWGSFKSSQKAAAYIGGTSGGDLVIADGLTTLKRHMAKRGPEIADRGAINTLPPNTIELRYFTSTLEENTLRGYFEFVEAMVEYTANPHVKARGGRTGNGTLTGMAFRKWLDTDGGTSYPHLMTLMKELGIPLHKAVTKDTFPYPGSKEQRHVVNGRNQ